MPRYPLGVAFLLLSACQRTGAPAAAPATAPSAAPETVPAPPTSERVVRFAVVGPERVRTVDGDVNAFRAAVPAVDTGGRCEQLPPAPTLGVRDRQLLYTFGERGSARRNVMIVVDSLNVPVRYSDVRGDLRGPNTPSITPANPLGPRTSISIDMRRMRGVLRNQGPTADTVNMSVRGPEIMDAESLGTPSRMIARVLAECSP
jgi:hypothetical protein